MSVLSTQRHSSGRGIGAPSPNLSPREGALQSFRRSQRKQVPEGAGGVEDTSKLQADILSRYRELKKSPQAVPQAPEASAPVVPPGAAPQPSAPKGGESVSADNYYEGAPGVTAQRIPFDSPEGWDEGQEGDFQGWYGQWAQSTGLNPNPDDPQHFYDYRAAYRAGAEPQEGEDGAYHWPSRYKKPDHPNRFVDGIDTITGKPMGGLSPSEAAQQAEMLKDAVDPWENPYGPTSAGYEARVAAEHAASPRQKKKAREAVDEWDQFERGHMPPTRKKAAPQETPTNVPQIAGISQGEDGIVRMNDKPILNRHGEPMKKMPTAMTHEGPAWITKGGILRTADGKAVNPVAESQLGGGQLWVNEKHYKAQLQEYSLEKLRAWRQQIDGAMNAGEKVNIYDAVQQIDRNLMEYLPFSPAGMTRMIRLNQLAEKYLRDGPEKMSEHERLEIENYLLDKQLRRDVGETMTARVTEGVAKIFPYAMEIFMSGPLAAVLRKGSKGVAAKAALKASEKKLLGKLLGTKIGGKALNAARAVAVESMIGGIRVGLNPAGFIEDTVRRTMPEIQLTPDEHGQFEAEVLQEGQGAGKAALNTFLDRWVEYTSEEAGEYFRALRLPTPLRNRLMKVALFKAFMRANPNKRLPDFVKALHRAGRQGLGAEIGEEQVGRFMRELLGVDLTEEQKAQSPMERQKRFWWGRGQGWRAFFEDALVETLTLAIPAAPNIPAQKMRDFQTRKAIIERQLERKTVPLEARMERRALQLLGKGATERAAAVGAKLPEGTGRRIILGLSMRREGEVGEEMSHEELGALVSERIMELVDKAEKEGGLKPQEEYALNTLIENRDDMDEIAAILGIRFNDTRPEEEALMQHEARKKRERREAEAARLEQKPGPAEVPGEAGEFDDPNSPEALEYLRKQLDISEQDVAKIPRAKREKMLADPEALREEAVARQAESREQTAERQRREAQEAAAKKKREHEAKLAEVERKRKEMEAREKVEAEAKRKKAEAKAKAEAGKKKARDLVTGEGKKRGHVSIEYLRTNLNIGRPEAQALLDEMEKEGVIGQKGEDGRYPVAGADRWRQEDKKVHLGGSVDSDGAVRPGTAEATVTETDDFDFSVQDSKGKELVRVDNVEVAKSVAEKILSAENRDKPMAERVAALTEDDMTALSTTVALKHARGRDLTDFETEVAKRAGLIKAETPPPAPPPDTPPPAAEELTGPPWPETATLGQLVDQAERIQTPGGQDLSRGRDGRVMMNLPTGQQMPFGEYTLRQMHGERGDRYTLVDLPIASTDTLERELLEPELVDEYATLDKAKRPPVLAMWNKIGDEPGQFIIIDGNHRAQAAHKAGETTIKAYIPEGDASRLAPAPPAPPAAPSGLGTVSEPNVAALSEEIEKRWDEIKDNPSLQKVVADIYGVDPKSMTIDLPGGLNTRAVQEAYESALVRKARHIVTHVGGPANERAERAFRQLKQLYANQVNISSRTSKRMKNQAYSTPVPYAWLVGLFAGLPSALSVLDTTAGNGALEIGAAEGAAVTVSDIDPVRIKNLQRNVGQRRGANAWSEPVDAETGLPPTVGKKAHDAVVANPPFGSSKPVMFQSYKLEKREHIIIARALLAMKDDGKAAFIIGGEMLPGQPLSSRDRTFFNWLYHHYNVTHNFDVSGSAFRKQGTGYNTRLIVVNGRKATPDGIAPQSEIKTKYDNTLDDLFEAYREDVKNGLLVRPETHADIGAVSTVDGAVGEAGEGSQVPGAVGGEAPAGTGEGGQVPRTGVSGGERGGRGPDTGGTGLAGRGPGQGESGKRGGERTGAGAESTGAEGGVPPTGEPGATGEGAGGGVGAQRPGAGERAGAGEPGGADIPVGMGGPAGADVGDTGRSAVDDAFDGIDIDFGDDAQAEGTGGRLYSIPVLDPKILVKLVDGGQKLALKAPEFRPFEKWAGLIYEKFGRNDEVLRYLPSAYTAIFREMSPEERAGMDNPGIIGQLDAAKVKDVLTNARKIKESREKQRAAQEKAAEQKEEERQEEREEEEGQSVRIAYNPTSAAPRAGTLIPKTLQQLVSASLAEVQRVHADIDQWVAESLKSSKQNLYKAFYAEQIDAIALSIFQQERGNALIIGDETGTGKGRTATGLLIYAMQRGKVPIFVTAQPGLFTDIYRDFQDVYQALYDIPDAEVNARLPKPFIINDNSKADIKDPKTGGKTVLFSHKGAQEKASFDRDFAMGLDAPFMKGKDLILMTYSQIQGKDSKRKQVFLRVAAGGGAIVMDESHTAAGKDSKRNAVMRGVLVHQHEGENMPADLVSYLSATYAKRPDTMGLYIRTILGSSAIDYDRLVDLLTEGGVPLQEWIAEELARGGQYIRREKDFSNIKFGLLESYVGLVEEEAVKRRNKLEQDVDSLTEHLRRIWQFDVALGPVRAFIEQKKKDQGAGGITRDERDAFNLSTTGFGSVVHNIVSQFMLAAHVDETVEHTIRLMHRNEDGTQSKDIVNKVVITTENTMETILSNMGIAIGQEVPDNFGIGVKRSLLTVLRYRWPDALGIIREDYITPEDMIEAGFSRLAQELEDINTALEEMAIDLPASPLDALREGLEARGFKVAEATGRKVKIVDGILTTRTAQEMDNRSIVDMFNRGDIDIVIGNESIASGLSMHAEDKTYTDGSRSDTRKRIMITAQPHKNIDVQVQLYGRINRWGQVTYPEIYAVTSQLPAEMRPIAVLMKKMRSLNANTTAKGDASFDLQAQDIMNKYGDEIAFQYFTDHPEVGAQIMLRYEMDDSMELKPVKPMKNFAAWATGKMAVLPTSVQREAYDWILTVYRDKIAELDAEGKNDLVSTHFDLKAEKLSRLVVNPAQDDSNGLTAGTYLDTFKVTNPYRAPSANEVQAMSRRNSGAIKKIVDLIHDKAMPWARRYVVESEKAWYDPESRSLVYRQGPAIPVRREAARKRYVEAQQKAHKKYNKARAAADKAFPVLIGPLQKKKDVEQRAVAREQRELAYEAAKNQRDADLKDAKSAYYEDRLKIKAIETTAGRQAKGTMTANMLVGIRATLNMLNEKLVVGGAYNWAGTGAGGDMNHENHVLVNVTVDAKATNPGAPSHVTLHFAEPGRKKIWAVPMSQIQSISKLEIDGSHEKGSRTLMSVWDQLRGDDKIEMQIVTGNLLNGLEFLSSQDIHSTVLTFTMADGTIMRGLMVPLENAVQQNRDVVIPKEVLLRLLADNKLNVFRSGPVTVTREADQLRVDVMLGKGVNALVTDQALMDMLTSSEGFVKGRTSYIGYAASENLVPLVDYLANRFGSFNVERSRVPQDIMDGGEISADAQYTTLRSRPGGRGSHGEGVDLDEAARPELPSQARKIRTTTIQVKLRGKQRITARDKSGETTTLEKSGTTFSGRLVGETKGRLNIEDEKGIRRSFNKRDVKEVSREITERAEMDPREEKGAVSFFRVEMPELVHFMRELMGKFPTVHRRIRVKGFGEAAGVFYSGGRKRGTIELMAAIAWDPEYAAKVAAHEIGHMLDWLEGDVKEIRGLGRGNILGRLVTLLNYTLTELPEYPQDLQTTKQIDQSVRNKLRAEAKKEAKGMLGDGASAERIKALQDELYQAKLEEFAKKKKVYSNQIIRKELINASAMWKPWDREKEKEKFRKYRDSSVELYADAMSIFLNSPNDLKAWAPTFFDALMHYFEKKPEAKKAYMAIQEDIRSGAINDFRLKNIYEMMEEGRKRTLEIRESRRTKFMDEVRAWKQGLWSRNAPLQRLIAGAAREGKLWDSNANPLFELERLALSSSAVSQYISDIESKVLLPLKEMGITTRDFAVYLFLNRVSTERKYLLNPLGMDLNTSPEVKRAMEDELGEDAIKLMEQLREKFFNIRTEHVVGVLLESGMYSAELMEKMANNDNYVTFNLQKYLETIGGEATGHIFSQVGTLQLITDPFDATVLKDTVLLGAAFKNEAKRSLIQWMASKTLYPGGLENAADEIRAADYETIEIRKGVVIKRPKESDRPEDKLVRIYHNGQIRGYYVPTAIANLYEADPLTAQKAWQFVARLSSVFKQLFTSKNPWWIAWNVQRDVKAAAKQLPKAGIFKMLLRMHQVRREAFIDVWGPDHKILEKIPGFRFLQNADQYHALAKEMKKKRMLLTGFGWTFTGRESDFDNEVEKLAHMAQTQYSEEGKTIGAKLKNIWEALDKPGEYFERLVKIAGYKYLLDNFEGMSEAEMAHLVITRAGSPNFRDGGKYRRIHNNIWLFSNASIQGTRAALEAATEKGSRVSYAFKTALYDVLPKVLMVGLAHGLGGDDWKRWWAKVPSWDKGRRLIIPLGWLMGKWRPDESVRKNGEAIYIVQPHDFVGEALAGAIWYMAEDIPKGQWDRLLGHIWDQNPFSSPNPLFQLIADASQFYVQQRSPYNSWMGQKVVPDQLMSLGTGWGTPAAKQFWKYELNQMGPGSLVFRFPRPGIQPVREGIAKMLRMPVLGPALMRFVRTSKRGEREEIERSPEFIAAARDYQKQSYEMGKLIKDALTKHQKFLTPSQQKALTSRLWMDAQRKGLVPSDYKKSYFARRFKYQHNIRFGSEMQKMLQSASPGERRAIRRMLNEEESQRLSF